ncbi:MAG TPA: site-specific integrase [Patescibacteria group bacterium]|nr:site-specific integrase [Patescibacteria group bacterium]
MPEKELDSVKNDFFKYLTSLGISSKSHKNYRSDLGHFLGWAILKIRSIGPYVESLTEVVPFLSFELMRDYKTYMIENTAPAKTVNRRLSTLRHLARFLTAVQTTDLDFMKGLENVTLRPGKKADVDPVINNFKAYLEAEKVSPNTVKNYLSDIKQFMSWLESNQQVNHSSN